MTSAGKAFVFSRPTKWTDTGRLVILDGRGGSFLADC